MRQLRFVTRIIGIRAPLETKGYFGSRGSISRQGHPFEAANCLAPVTRNNDDISMDCQGITRGNKNAFVSRTLLAEWNPKLTIQRTDPSRPL